MTRSHHPWPAATSPHDQRPDPSLTFVARLVFATGHGPRSIIVECYRIDDGYSIHVPEFNEAANYLVDTVVTLTPVGAESAHPADWTTGRSRLLADRDVDPGTISALERWSDGIPAHYFHITATSPLTESRGHSHRRGIHHTPVRHGQPVRTP